MFVTGDVKPGVLGVPIARRLRLSYRASISVLAENPSAGHWFKNGFVPNTSDVVETFIRQTRPDVVVAGISSPTSLGFGLEEEATQAARALSIPVVFLDDDWGCFKRRAFDPSMYLTIDPLGQKLIRDHHGVHAMLMGDDAVGVSPPTDLAVQVEEMRANGTIVALLYSNKDPRSEAVLDVALRSAEMSTSAVLVPTHHPGASTEFKQKCAARIAAFKKQYPEKIWEAPEAKADHMAALADITFGIGGTGMRVTCHHGKTPVYAWSPKIGEQLREETGAEHQVLVERKFALERKRGMPFKILLQDDQRYFRDKREEFLNPPVPFSPERAAAAIVPFAQ